MLSARSPALAVAWKRFRSQHVIKAVKNWCEQNAIHDHLVFDELPKPSPLSRQAATHDERLKSLLLTAVARMSAEELMKLNLPASHLVAVLRPELLG